MGAFCQITLTSCLLLVRLLRLHLPSLRTIKFCSVLVGIVVSACCHKQDSLMRGGLRDKRTSTLSAINYATVEIVDDTPPVIHAKARYWSRIAIFTARRVCIARTMPWPHVRLSVCLSHAGIMSKQLHISSIFFHRQVAPPF